MAEATPEEVQEGLWTDEHPSGYVHINLRTNSKVENAHGEERTVKKDESHTFPAFLPDWSNYDVLHKNTLPPRASFFVYDNASDAYTRDVTRSKTLCLSGEWKFDLAKSPFDAV